MKQLPTTLRNVSLVLLYAATQVLVPTALQAETLKPKGKVDVVLEWHDGRQIYTYVFRGVVTRRGKPCANAKVELQMSTTQSDLVRVTTASDNGAYELTISLSGVPADSADWKLIAQANQIGAQSVEVEGRAILSESVATVFVQKPIQLIEG